jgi:HAD superfamily hydrolase (TIGR01509 family)
MAALDEMYRRRRLEVHSSGIEMELVPELLALFGHGGFAVESWMVLRTLDALEYGCLPYAFPFPGVHRCLSRLSEAGTRMAVLSSALYAPFLTWALERFGLLRYFEKILTSVEAGYYKSDPRLFRSLLDDLGVDAVDAVHVGDSYRFDVEGAKRAGIKVVWFNAGGGPSLADASVDNLVGLPDVIAAL